VVDSAVAFDCVRAATFGAVTKFPTPAKIPTTNRESVVRFILVVFLH